MATILRRDEPGDRWPGLTAVEEYLQELDGLRQTRGRSRRRLLRECRSHLQAASDAAGPDEAIRRFGPAADLAAAFDVECAARRRRSSTVASCVGVAGVAVSTLALVDAASVTAPAAVPWAVIFFGAAQVAAVCLVLGALQAAAMRHASVDLSSVALLCRRNGTGLAFAVLTWVAAAGAVPGNGSPVTLLAGPLLALLAAVGVVGTWRLVRRIDAPVTRTVRSPLEDAAALLILRGSGTSLGSLLPWIAALTAVAVFAWD